jgi:alpha-amylase/alpha-mannosidase (GH57 family)
MNDICLAVLWHQHQPSYVPHAGMPAPLPWVRLHAIKDYVGMALLARRFPDFHHTINLVPCLLDQLEALVAGEATDADLLLTERPAGELTEDEALSVLDCFFAANIDTMVRPNPRYAQLLAKREPSRRTAAQVLPEFSVSDMRDLQVWHTLAWFHPLVVGERADLKDLVRKGSSFTEEDKQAVLAAQREVMARVIPLHKELQEAGVVELVTSPRYHPILPLLFRMESARVALRDLPLPNNSFDGSADAVQQIAEAVESHTRRFGRRPKGLWPPEGAVSPEILEAVADAGIRWLASDEEVLGRSLGAEVRRPGGDVPAPSWLDGPYEVDAGAGRKLTMAFRDHVLSDRIGFQYARFPSGREAAADLLGRIKQARSPVPSQPALVAVMLDGENPWEFYRMQGLEFLEAFYGAVGKDGQVRAVTIGEYLDAYGPVGRIEHLHSGSWIGANFGTWVGQTEKNRAWELLARAKAAVESAAAQRPASELAAAHDAIRKAEGSDWFWWYGEDHSSGQEDQFDRLFRAHLGEAYVRAGLPVRDEVEGTITELRPLYSEPQFLLDVQVDGWVTSYYEWLGAGYYDSRRDAGAMRQAGGRAASQLYFGYSLVSFFLRLDPERPKSGTYGMDWSVKAVFSNGMEALSALTGSEHGPTAIHLTDGRRSGGKKETGLACRGNTLEMAIPWEQLGLRTGDGVGFHVEIWRGDESIQRLPYGSDISLTVPAADFGADAWTA